MTSKSGANPHEGVKRIPQMPVVRKELLLKDTLSGEFKPVRPHDGKTVQMYVCGITPYDESHLGHARTFVAFDVLRRWIEDGLGMGINHIQNVTDIDDKIIKRAGEKKMMPLALSDLYDRKARELFYNTLNVRPPHQMPKISEHIPQTIAMIQKLLDAGTAYATRSGIYYDISKFRGYGALSHQDLQRIRAGARVEVDEDKRHPEDFALWKLEAAPGATYPSPWGEGRPGWHIECSAMSMHCTHGHSLDIHGGARDLIFPHHENEIAQSEGAGYKPFSHLWAHTGFLTVEGEKMSKSLGNFITIEQALKSWDADTLRLFFILTHYSSPLDFSKAALDSAKNTLDNVRRSLAVMEGEGRPSGVSNADDSLHLEISEACLEFERHMNNDLDTPQALAALIRAAKAVARARSENQCGRATLQAGSAQVARIFESLGLRMRVEPVRGKMPKSEIEALIAQREAARKSKDFKTSDEIRARLTEAGVVLEDAKDGVRWRYA